MTATFSNLQGDQILLSEAGRIGIDTTATRDHSLSVSPLFLKGGRRGFVLRPLQIHLHHSVDYILPA